MTKNFKQNQITPNNFQIANQHFQVMPNLSSKIFVLIQLLKFSPGAYWMWAFKRCLNFYCNLNFIFKYFISFFLSIFSYSKFLIFLWQRWNDDNYKRAQIWTLFDIDGVKSRHNELFSSRAYAKTYISAYVQNYINLNSALEKIFNHI